MSVAGFHQGSRKPKLRSVQMFPMGEIGLYCSVHVLLVRVCHTAPPLLVLLGPTVISALLLLPHEHRPFSLLGGEERAQSEEKTCPFSEKNPHCSTALFVSYLNSKLLRRTSVTLYLTLWIKISPFTVIPVCTVKSEDGIFATFNAGRSDNLQNVVNTCHCIFIVMVVAL